MCPKTPTGPNDVISDDTLHFDYPDIVLRSCDSHDFRVPKLYIVICSPVLRDLIQSVSNASDVPNGGGEHAPLPVVKLPESKATLYNLLTFIFPVTPILPSTPEKIMELLAVAQKYQMDSVLAHIRGAISRQDPPFIRPETAFRIYFLAQQHGLHQEARQAARVTLRLPMTIESLEDKLEFPGMTGAYLYELWNYHLRVRTDLKSGIVGFKNSCLPDNVKHLRCTSPRSGQNSSLPWLDAYIGLIAGALHLFDHFEFENARASHIKSETYNYNQGYDSYSGYSSYHSQHYSQTCSCVDISSQVMRAFWEALTAFVHRAIEKVRRIGVTRLYRDN
ncbi:hypothetical protein BJY52DRAFT_1127979 [Lactarius psammicola]|nr:hypothetical protein BJY52DRAFT_1127979 [Lactarius psammicola]